MNQTYLNKLHKAQLEIMDEIHRVCEEENITYYLLFGSLIGAVRHNGFIPWDYDIDCGMIREDYERFADACKNGKLNSRFVYYDSKNVYGNIHVHAIVSLKNTVLRTCHEKYNKESFNYGIYVDIFPLDNAPDYRIDQENQSKALNIIQHKMYIKRHYCFNNSWFMKLLKWLRSLLITENWDLLFEQLENESRRYNNIKTHYYIQNYGYVGGPIPQEWFGKPILKDFENRQYYIPQDYDKFLTRFYGDYMTLPPEEKRNASNNYVEYASFDREY